jgi:hypothetical protein
MSKKIDAARKALTKAIKKHAEIAGGAAVPLKKAERAAAAVREAATTYATIVHAKTGLESPFDGMVSLGLEPATIASLVAERDKIATRPIKTVSAVAS